VPLSTLTELKLTRPSPDKVLRKAVRGRVTVLVPATAAMAVVLRHKLEKEAPSMDALKAMFPTGIAGFPTPSWQPLANLYVL
jgi:hypothetical protein